LPLERYTILPNSESVQFTSSESAYYFTKSDILVAVNIKIVVLWDLIPYFLVDRYQSLRGIFYLEMEAAGSVTMLVPVPIKLHGITSQKTMIFMFSIVLYVS
jgi:hypothetical protein